MEHQVNKTLSVVLFCVFGFDEDVQHGWHQKCSTNASTTSKWIVTALQSYCGNSYAPTTSHFSSPQPQPHNHTTTQPHSHTTTYHTTHHTTHHPQTTPQCTTHHTTRDTPSNHTTLNTTRKSTAQLPWSQYSVTKNGFCSSRHAPYRVTTLGCRVILHTHCDQHNRAIKRTPKKKKPQKGNFVVKIVPRKRNGIDIELFDRHGFALICTCLPIRSIWFVFLEGWLPLYTLHSGDLYMRLPNMTSSYVIGVSKRTFPVLAKFKMMSNAFHSMTDVKSSGKKKLNVCMGEKSVWVTHYVGSTWPTWKL